MKKFYLFLVIASLLFVMSAIAAEMPTISNYAMNSTVLTSDAVNSHITASSGTGTVNWASGSGITVLGSEIVASNEDGKRYVQLFVADPDRKVSVEDSVLYKSEPFLTDLSDRELYFSIEVVKLLADYNKKRVKMIDKDASKNGRDVYLEPIRIRDLKMVVVNIAVF